MIYKILSALVVLFLFSCKTTKFYVVRHAEKEAATMASDVELSPQGKARAESLKEVLQGENIKLIYSTPYIRTRSTVQPLASFLNIPVLEYKPMDTAWMKHLRNATQPTLIVGHSNTVDDIVNHLLGDKQIQGDLPETQYGDLFIITRKGKKFSFERRSF